jgi:hypothetical protein
MRLVKNNNLIRPNRFYRGIAIFFLLFTAFDLTSSWPCQEDGLENFAVTRQADYAAQSVAASETTPSEQPDHQPGSGVEEHDCFCCCTHLVPISIVRVADLRIQAEAIPRTLISIPSAPPQGTDHPPRLA